MIATEGQDCVGIHRLTLHVFQHEGIANINNVTDRLIATHQFEVAPAIAGGIHQHSRGITYLIQAIRKRIAVL
jgi:hypothetical protein